MAEDTPKEIEYPGAPLGKLGHEPRDQDVNDQVRQVVRKLVEETPEQRDPLGDVATVAIGGTIGAAVLGSTSGPIREALVTYAPWFDPSRVDLILIGLFIAGLAYGVRVWRRRK